MSLILYLLGAVLMAETIASDTDEETPLIAWIVNALLWPLHSLIFLWFGLFGGVPSDDE